MRLVNGRPSDTLCLNDRAIQFGDGVFRTIKQREGQLVFWRRHYRKLSADCAALGIVVPAEALLLADIRALTSQSGLQDAAVKIIVSRGESQRGYAVPAECQATRIVQIAALLHYPASLYRQGATLRLCETRAGWQPALAGIKHLNRLENVLARREWSDPAILEGLLLDRDGHVLEGVMSNVLVRRADILQTPLLDTGGVAGVMREVALEAAAELGWQLEQCRLKLDDLRSADQVWICNSLLGLIPVSRLDDAVWPVTEPDFLAEQVAKIEREEME